MNSRIQKRFPTPLAVTIGAAAFIGIVLASATASAKTFNITTNSTVDKNKDGLCTLREAVLAINGQATHNECTYTTGTPDVITLKTGIGDYTLTSPLQITRSVTIRSATTNTLAKIAQSSTSFPMNSELIDLEISGGATVEFRDIDVYGANKNHVGGISGQGNDTFEELILTRSWVERFDRCGVDLLGLSLSAADSSIDSNTGTGINLGFASGVAVEGADWPTHVELSNTSVTRNRNGGGLGLELARGSYSTIYNSTIADNSGGAGIALASISVDAQTSLTIVQSTIADNSCVDDGTRKSCGIDNSQNTNGEWNIIDVYGTLIGSNYYTDGLDAQYSGQLAILQDSLLEDSEMATIETISGESLTDYGLTYLDALRDNGGVGGRHPLTRKPSHGASGTCLCIDATGTNYVYIDERHKTRPFDATFISTGFTVDIGAVELQQGE